MTDLVEAILHERPFGDPRAVVHVRTQALRGGLEAEVVHLVTATMADARVVRVVRKVARGASAREARVYARLVARYTPELAPRVVHSTRIAKSCVLYLEALPKQPWPWRDVDAASAVLERVAALHALAPPRGVLPRWDYEAELARQAASTVEVARGLGVRGLLPVLERVVDALPRIRRILCTTRPFAGVIHGDLHPGNVLHRANRVDQPVLVDWARARHGSALEDVSSWLHSLGAWEPEARRRHDALFTRYLAARGMSPKLTADVRDLYWLAGASNALAGALAYQLAVAARGDGSASRYAHHWSRVLRRADERLR